MISARILSASPPRLTVRIPPVMRSGTTATFVNPCRASASRARFGGQIESQRNSIRHADGWLQRYCCRRRGVKMRRRRLAAPEKSCRKCCIDIDFYLDT